ncbi:RNase T domain containing protein [Trichuris trichiura]|uniref:RNase T domain containing protein n=1 Tax=Trichuris trichiura TaxID=36087 RepID=A0A077ZBY0_TRITR|nr:RNase T domain containing protein [Trichuris trichiura]
MPNQTNDKIDPRSLRLVWIDCEMTGLDVNTKHLLEVACIITEGDPSLKIVAKGPNLIIHQSEKVLDKMDEWSAIKHGEVNSGLTEEVRKSTLTVDEAEEQLLQFVKCHVPEQTCPLAGNTCSQDRAFLKKYMPRLVDHLHHRNVDVSSFKEMCRYSLNLKNICFRAMDDIEGSREEMLHYIKHLFPNTNDSF